jgi:cytidylate kinase
MFNVVTIAREYGSGGADIGRKVAELLGWVCVDKQIIQRVATMGNVDPAWAETADEHVSAWWERVMKSFRQGGPESFVGKGPEFGVDRDTLQQFTANVIERAARESHCVIIGRSAQCVLQRRPQVLHVLVYGPLAEKVVRMKCRHPQEYNLPDVLHRIDSERTLYTKTYYGHDWSDRGLYHLCVNSTLGIDACAKLILQTIQSYVQSVNEIDFRRDEKGMDVIKKS